MSHPTHDVLADLVAENVADAATVQQHVDACPACQEQVAEIAAAQEVLRDAPSESMPAEVAARLNQVIASEVQRRKSGVDEAEHEAETAAAAARTALGSFGANLPDLGDKLIGPRNAKRITVR